jgi:2-polyprenyl-6-methoxyphenol hydroxylase-like FAD-dependent oxidoreductase
MRQTDIVIAGGGLAGSTAAAMLARQGFDIVFIDPHATYPFDLRCEKLVGRQVRILTRTGLADTVLSAATLDRECWVAQFGRVVLKRPPDQWGILYDTLVNTVRGAIAAGTPFVQGKVAHIANGPQRQVVVLSTGEEISARLVVLANGLNTGLRHSLGMVREDVSPCHCITIAFDLVPAGRDSFDFSALTCFGGRPADGIGYLTLFPIGTTMRANLFVYRRLDDPWLQELKQHPLAAMFAALPGLERLLGPAEVAGPVKMRPVDLYVTRGHVQPGVVLVGDAFASTCPAAGTGADKVFTDVERLCNVHIPRWMASAGMDAEKIAAFYADPVKRACDRFSYEKAFSARSVSTDEHLPWAARRWARFSAWTAMGTARRAMQRIRPQPMTPAALDGERRSAHRS